MKQIRIAQPTGLDQLTLEDAMEPGQPGPGEIRVRLYASSLNYHDLGVASGQMPASPGRIPMSDGAGVVDAIGEGVGEFQVGDSVVSCFFPQWQTGPVPVQDFSGTPGDGIDGYAREVVVTPAQWFTHAPKGYTHTEAATLTTAGLTAWRALVVEGGLKAGDTVLTMGTGGVSIFALQLAKSMGARVIATSSSDEKLETLKAMGADEVVNYRTYPEWSEQVQALTEGQGVDQVVEVGGPATLAQSIRACRVGGHISLIGVLTGFDGKIPTAELMLKQQRLKGVVVGSREHQKALIAALESTGVKPKIDRAFALSDLRDAFEYEMSGQHFGKIVVDYTL